ISDAGNVTEGNSGTTNAVFTITLSLPSTQTIMVYYDSQDGTRTSGSDYPSVYTAAIFNPGETSKNVNVAVKGDTVVEGNESFSVWIAGTPAYSVGRSQGFATIVDD